MLYLFLALLVQHCNIAVRLAYVLVSRFFPVIVFFPSVITCSQGEICVLLLEENVFIIFILVMVKPSRVVRE